MRDDKVSIQDVVAEDDREIVAKDTQGVSRFKRTLADIARGMRRFAPVVGCAYAAAIAMIVLLENTKNMQEDPKEIFARVVMALVVGTFLALCAKLFVERVSATYPEKTFPASVATWVTWAALTIAYYLSLNTFVFGQYGQAPAIHLIRIFAIIFSAVAFSIAIPYFKRHKGDEVFALDLLWRFFITGMFTIALAGGIALVLFMLDSLLNFDIKDVRYVEVIALCIGVFGVTFFVGGIPERPRDLAGSNIAKLWRVFWGNLIFPLLSIYTVIVYSYFVRTLLIRQWPSNMMVNLVLWYTAIGVLALYFMREEVGHSRFYRLFDRWYSILTVLPLVLMFTGLVIRIAAYGWTINRYFVLVFGAWVAICTMQYIVLKPDRRLNLLVPTLFCVIAVVSVVGPWNAMSVSINSQTARLESLLNKYDMISSDSKLVAVTEADKVLDADKTSIYSTIQYLGQYDKLSALAYMPKEIEVWDMAKELGFDDPSMIFDDDEDGVDTRSFGPLYSSTNYSVKGYDELVQFTYGTRFEKVDEHTTVELTAEQKIIIKIDGREAASFDLMTLSEKAFESVTANRPSDGYNSTVDNEAISAKCMFISGSVDRDPTTKKAISVSIESVVVLLRVK